MVGWLAEGELGMFRGMQERSHPLGSTGLLGRRKWGCAVMSDSETCTPVTGGQEWHRLQFNCEMEMSGQR